MKLLHVFDLISPSRGGGMVTIIRNVSRALTMKGHEVTIYTSDFQLDQEYLKSLPNARVHPFHCISSAGNFYYTPAIKSVIRKQLKKFDVIHLHCFRSYQNIVIHQYAKKYGIPYIIDAHGSMPRTSSSSRSIKWFLKWLFDVFYGRNILQDASKVVAETEDGFNEYTAMGVKKEDIRLITPPFDISEFSELPPPGTFRDRYEITTDHIVMFLGRIHWIKGIDFLVESFGEMSKLRDDTALVIAGPDEGHMPVLKKLVNRLNLSDKVIFTGFIGGESKLSALVDADVVVQTSIYEQGTGVPFEAILCGTPIIVSRDTVASCNVKDIDAGYLVEYGNKEEMVEVLQYVLDNPGEAKVKTRRAAAYIRENLSLEKGAEKYEQLYKEVVRQA
jgi:glycosyltransferase involved in cell wall biosynthesis